MTYDVHEDEAQGDSAGAAVVRLGVVRQPRGEYGGRRVSTWYGEEQGPV